MFSFTKVCIFYQWCLSGLSSQHYVSKIFVFRTFITTLCFYDFWKTVLVNKCTPCQGVVWFSPSKCHIFLHWLLSSTLLTQLKPPEASEQAAKKVEGAALKLPLGLTRPGPCEPKFWKNDLPANLFLLCVLPQKRNEFTPAFKHVLHKHTFSHVFKNEGMYGCHIFLGMC